MMPQLQPKKKYFGWYYQTLRMTDPQPNIYMGMNNGKEIRRRQKSIQRGYVKVFNPEGQMVDSFLTVKRAKQYIKTMSKSLTVGSANRVDGIPTQHQATQLK